MLHKFLSLIFEHFQCFVGRRSAVGGKSGEHRSDVRLGIGILRHLGGDTDDERRELVTCADDQVPYLIAHIDLLTLVMVKLSADGLQQILLYLSDGPCAECIRLRLLQLENHVFGFGALQEQRQTFVCTQTDRRDSLLALSL